MSKQKDQPIIIAADLHLRLDRPRCRIDDYLKAQAAKFAFLLELWQEYYLCPFIIAGDVFHHYRVSPELESWTIDQIRKARSSEDPPLSDECYSSRLLAIPGQHDLPQHQSQLLYKSSLQVLNAAGVIDLQDSPDELFPDCVVHFFPWGEPIALPIRKEADTQIAVAHTLVFDSPKGVPADLASKALQFPITSAEDLLKKLPGYDLIIVGDNHKTFVVEQDGRLLVSPGSMMRTTADQINHKPSVFLYWPVEHVLEQIELPCAPGTEVISREHIDQPAEVEAKAQAFVEMLRKDVEIGMSFRANLEAYLAANKVSTDVKQAVWEALGG
ncbi:MAG: metallophosphoesterase [Gammaproteobacteria bacterium]|nr:metallophosphoesterase [Gammaproteobacteria bacterium]